MPRYYFDMTDYNGLLVDDEGVELRDLDAVQEEAARSLADMARDAARGFKGSAVQQMTVEVRDDSGPVLEAKFCFEIARRQ